MAAASDNYRIKPQTRVKVTIVEWIASTGEYKEWTALNGEYVVSPAGAISIPLIGEIAVADSTTGGVADRIALALRERTGLATPPTTTVEVVRYPMIYVTGSVDRPGELEFRPGLTVMQAVAMAGGRERRINSAGGYSDLEQIRYLGELNRYELLLKQLAGRRARLQAELDGSPAVTVPAELATESEGSIGSQIIADEINLFAARAEALKHQLQALDDLQALLRSEIGVLDEKTTAQDRQIKIAQDELESISRLVSVGTLTKSRETSLERIVADLRSAKLDLVVASMRAKQKLSETQRDALTLKGQRRTEAGRDLQTAEAEIEDAKLKRGTTVQLLQMAGTLLSREGDKRAAELQPLEYWVTRRGDSATPMKVQQSTILEPGDVLDVRYDLSSGIDSMLLSTTDAATYR